MAPAPATAPPAEGPREAGTVPAGWPASLRLIFERRGARTVLARRQHQGPLLVQRPFYPEGPGVGHVYLLHPPAGVVGGDRLAVTLDVRPEAHALVTTPAAGKLYRSGGPTAAQTQALHVAPGAVLEWLPQETIAFAGTRSALTTRVELAGDAAFLGWELLCLGRPAAGEAFTHGTVSQHLELYREGRPLLWERGRYTGGDPLLDAPWGLAGRPVTATLVCAGGPPDLAARLQEAVPPPAAGDLGGVSAVNGVVVCRYLGRWALDARAWLAAAWALARPAITGREATTPRIWNT